MRAALRAGTWRCLAHLDFTGFAETHYHSTVYPRIGAVKRCKARGRLPKDVELGTFYVLRDQPEGFVFAGAWTTLEEAILAFDDIAGDGL